MNRAPRQGSDWDRDGYLLIEGFADESVCDAMHRRAVEIARDARGGGMAGRAFVVPESRGESKRA